MFTNHYARSTSTSLSQSSVQSVPDAVKAARRGDLNHLRSLINKFDSDDFSDIIDAVDLYSGVTPLIASVMKGHRHIMLYLLRLGAAVDHADHSGWTALHWACYQQFTELTAHLIAHGADVSLQDNEGLTAEDWARRRGGDVVHVFDRMEEAVQFSAMRIAKYPPPEDLEDDSVSEDDFPVSEDEDEDDEEAADDEADVSSASDEEEGKGEGAKVRKKKADSGRGKTKVKPS